MIYRPELPTLCLGLTPCPNDTFVYHAWIHQLISCSFNLQPIFADIQTLNELALQSQLPFCKISAALLPHLKGYRQLSCGAALGHANGPKVIAKTPFDPSELAQKRVAFPGKETTAYSLYRKLLPAPKEEQFLSYDKLMGQLKRRLVDAAVIIHETRFSFEEQGCFEIADLGELWHTKKQLPIPLAVIVAREDITKQQELVFMDHLKRSLAFARKNPMSSETFVASYSAELYSSVRRKHIDLFVNEETSQLSNAGQAAIDAFLSN